MKVLIPEMLVRFHIEPMINLSPVKVVYVCKSQRMHAILSNYISILEMSCSNHLALYWWALETKGHSPVSWPALEPLFMPVKRGWLTSCSAGILLYIFIRPRPQCQLVNDSSLSSASLHHILCIAQSWYQSLTKDRCWEGERDWDQKLQMTKKMVKNHKRFLKFLL